MVYWKIALGLYMMLGLAMFEWAWKEMRPIREIKEERDSKYPAYRRWDVPKWAKWKFYPGAILLLPIKFLFALLCVILLYVIVKIVTIGHDFNKDEPIRGWFRITVLGYIYKLMTSVLLLGIGIRSSYEKREYDYTYFLGPNYKETTAYPKYYSTYVSNHTSWLDIIFLISYIRPAFTPKAVLRKIPIFGVIVQALGCIFIARGGNEEERNQIVEQICERQRIIEAEGEYPPIVIFAEGGTSNGRYLLQFKRGAFIGGHAVKPVVLRYSYGTMSPSYDVAPFFPLLIMTLCLNFDCKCELMELPLFVPNEYLYRTHADKIAHNPTHDSRSPVRDTENTQNHVADKWEIYAWAVREVISMASGFIKNDQPLREKLKYEETLGYLKPRDINQKNDE